MVIQIHHSIVDKVFSDCIFISILFILKIIISIIILLTNNPEIIIISVILIIDDILIRLICNNLPKRFPSLRLNFAWIIAVNSVAVVIYKRLRKSLDHIHSLSYYIILKTILALRKILQWLLSFWIILTVCLFRLIRINILFVWKLAVHWSLNLIYFIFLNICIIVILILLLVIFTKLLNLILLLFHFL